MIVQATNASPAHMPDRALELPGTQICESLRAPSDLSSSGANLLPLSLYELGYTDVIPIAPPNATVSSDSSLKRSALGKVPGIRKPNGTWVGYPEWLTARHTVDEVREWIAWSANVGLRSKNFPGLDIDSPDPVLAGKIEKLALEHLGWAPTRFGQKPKRLLMYQTSQPFGRMRIWGTSGEPGSPDYVRHLVEFLGDGQQYVVYGQHPCGTSYEWTEDMHELLADALTPITKEKAETFREIVAAEFRKSGLEVSYEGDGTPPTKVSVDQQGLRAPSLEHVQRVLKFIPNGGDFDQRDEWLKMAYALKGACSVENAHEAKQLFIEWSLTWPGDHKHPHGNDLAVVEAEYDRCTGAPTLGYSWLCDRARGHGFSNAQDDFQALDPAPEVKEEQLPSYVDKLNREYALVKELSRAVLCTPPDDCVSLMEIAHWKNHVSLNPRISAAWLRHPQRREYRRLVIDPAHPPRAAVPNGTRLDDFNLWEGFPLKPSIEGSCDLFLKHLRDIICDGDPRLYEWVVTWIADMFQSPGRPVGTALVLRGAQGAGKDTVGEVLGAICGERHYTVVSNPEEVTGGFNAHLEGRILLHAEEAFFAGDKRTVGKLKSLITSPRLRINQKHLPTYEVATLLHLLITSNEEWVVPAELGERRFAVLDVSNARAKDRAHFGALRRQMFSEGGCARLLHHLLHEVKVDRDLISQPPSTKALLSQQERGFNAMQRWAMECAIKGRLPGGGSSPSTDSVFSAIRLSTRDRREADRATPTSIGEFLVQYGVKRRRDGSGKRGYRYVFPSLEKFRAALASKLSISPEWDEVEEWEAEVPGSLENLK